MALVWILGGSQLDLGRACGGYWVDIGRYWGGYWGDAYYQSCRPQTVDLDCRLQTCRPTELLQITPLRSLVALLKGGRRT